VGNKAPDHPERRSGLEGSAPGLENFIVVCFEPGIATPAPRQHLLGPIQILPPPLQRPIRRWRPRHVQDIGDLVAELDLFGLDRTTRGVLHLESLAFRLWQLLVIRHLRNQGPDLPAKVCLEFLGCGLCILDRVMKHCSRQGNQIRDAASSREDRCDLDGMVDVWRGVDILAPLMAVLGCRELKGGK
jgi:hypothetical protein